MRPFPNSLRRRGGAPVALLGNTELRRAMVGPAHPCGHRRGRPRARLRNRGSGMASGAAGPPSLPRFNAAASPSLRGGVTSSCAGGAGTASWSCARSGGCTARAGGRREEEQSAAALHSLLCRRQLPWSPSSTGTTRRPRTRTAASAGRRRAGVLGAERAAASSAQSRSRTPLKREKEGDIERREREVTLTGGPHYHVASTSAKPPCKTAGWPNVNGFNS